MKTNFMFTHQIGTKPIHTGMDFLELLFVAKGTIDHHINGITERIGTGGYLIVDLGEVHSMERVSEEPIYITNFLFLPEFLDRTLAGKKKI